MTELYNLTLKELSNKIQNKDVSVTELVESTFSRIKETEDQIGSFITLNEAKSLELAKELDAKGPDATKPLAGIPIGIKDNIVTKDLLTTAASKMLYNFEPPYDATVMTKIYDNGMIPVGKLNMDEFAMGSGTETSYFKKTVNPWNSEKVPGGSSGGSAAVIAARLAPVALGSDTGGSIRQPASHCGITGLKPTYGVVSRFGMVAYASSFDQAGPMAQTAEDCALLLNAMASFDERDSTSLDRVKEDYSRDLNRPLAGLKVGLAKEYCGKGMDADVQRALQVSIDLLKAQGAQIVDVTLPQTELSIPAYYVLASAEASTNLSRFDGVRYGHRAAQFSDLDEMYSNTRAEGFGSEVKRRILIGTYVLSHGYYDAYYLKAQKLRRLVANDFQVAFKQCDIILAPVAPTAAPKLDSDIHDPIQMYLSDIYTIAVNLAGLPAMSLPAGFAANGLPIGVQLIGDYFAEAKLLNVAHQMQLNSDVHLKSPL